VDSGNTGVDDVPLLASRPLALDLQSTLPKPQTHRNRSLTPPQPRRRRRLCRRLSEALCASRSPDYVRLQARASLSPYSRPTGRSKHAPPWTNMRDGSQSVDLIHALRPTRPRTPLNWDDDSSSMIDETVAEIRAMRTHSTSAVAVKATRSLADLLDREYVTVDEFERPRPRTQRRCVAAVEPLPRRAPQRDARGRALDRRRGRRASRTANSDSKTLSTASSSTTSRRRKGRPPPTRPSIEDGDTLLVHDYSTTVLEAIENAARDGAHLTVYVTEARPRTLGRKTARVLAGIARVDTRWWSIARWGTPSATATRSSSGSRV